MSLSLRFRFVLLGSALWAVSQVQAGVSLLWQGSDAKVDQQVMEVLADSKILSDFVSMINQNFDLDPAPVLSLGASEGPSLDRTTHVLNLPHGYLARAIVTQSELVEDKNEALQRGLNVVEYTLYYLLGHALVQTEPKTGDSADNDKRAEALATWVMLSHWPNGGEQWSADVAAFADASQKLDGPLSDFWHEHSLYQLREDQLNCWILGKDPKEHARLLPARQTSASRRRQCVASWKELDRNAASELGAVLKSDAPLRLK